MATMPAHLRAALAGYAWARDSVGESDAALQQRLLQQYGVLDADQEKQQFHLLLDELF
nr:hypothetical protein [Janthinobacterium sp. UMAB-56]